ncbi:MAG: hypothetical protein SFV52_00540 [Saprospiraceae bacterium]|nr:hypothetical protein [Saprospiraceae bacterium]
MPHGNSHQNFEEHHLYEIYDTIENDVYKYGVCGKPLMPDGSSSRANKQVREYNRVVGMLRFIANILLVGIPGKKRGEEIEEEYVNQYEAIHGRRPRGNPKKGQ